MVTVPESLADPELRPVWEATRQRLERSGLDNRGRLSLPPLSARARHVLESLAGRASSSLDLARLETGLLRLGIGTDLAEALALLGEPVSLEPARRRAARQEAETARRRARRQAGMWPEPWAVEWVDEVIGAGLLAGMGRDQAEGFIHQVRSVVDHLPQNGRVSRTELAARVVGSAHALDEGTRLATAVTRALRFIVAGSDGTDLWEQAGIQPDLVSGAALTWGLAVEDGSPLTGLVTAAAALAVPLHLTQISLRRHPLRPPPGLEVLVVENPRVVEAAAERHYPGAVVSTNGNPSGAVRLLLGQLLSGGANLSYHGDFDPGGLAICSRLHSLGLRPWRMDATDYRAAIESANGVDLPLADRKTGPTPWDPELADVFNSTRRIVHQERLLEVILRGRSDQ